VDRYCPDLTVLWTPQTAVGIPPDQAREDQTVSWWRPLSRRAFKTARPARVRIRARKPCVLARLRWFGWYVRFTKTSSQTFL